MEIHVTDMVRDMAYLHEMEVLGAAGKAVRGWKVQKPTGAVRDLWVRLDASERCMRV